jgi:hypothetical protein
MDFPFRRRLCFVMTSFGLVSCTLDPLLMDRVSLSLPCIPESWKGLDGIDCMLSWRDPRGKQRRQRVEPGGLVELELARGRCQALLFEPRIRGHPLKPGGAIYPWDLEFSPGLPSISVSAISLDWQGGWAASLFRILDEEGPGAGGFDLPRLAMEARRRLSDPWAIDPRIVARRLIEGSFRLDTLREPSLMELRLPGPGPWHPESPLAQLPSPIEGGYSALLYPGLQHLFGPDLELFVAPRGDSEPALIVMPLSTE